MTSGGGFFSRIVTRGRNGIRSVASRLIARKPAPEPLSEAWISISDPIEDIPWNASQIATSRDCRWSVDIENLSSATLLRCRVVEARFIDENGRLRSKPGRSFRLRSERYSPKAQHPPEKSFSLRSGARVGIDICMATGDDETSGVLMAYAAPSFEDVNAAIPHDAFPWWLTVQVSAEGLRPSIEKTFKIYVAAGRQLRMETAVVSSTPAFDSGCVSYSFAESAAFAGPSCGARGLAQGNPSGL